MADERDPRVPRRYRELGAEEPSRELDQTILAAAHRAAERPHAPLVTPAGRHRWYFAFGAAAILVLAVAVTVQVERQQPDPEAVALNQPPVASDRKEEFSYYQEAPPPAAQEPKEAKRAEPRKQVERPKPQPSKPEPGLTPDAAPAQEAPRELARDAAPARPPVAESQPENRDEAYSADARRREGLLSNRVQGATGRVAPAAPAPRAAPAPQARVDIAAAAPLSPERLLERIAELRKEGRHDEADRLLAEFRERYPDYRISEDMLKKVERGK